MTAFHLLSLVGNNMKIYFAGSITGGRGDKDLYAEIIKKLTSFGEVLTEHVGSKTLSAMGEDGPTPKYIYDRDMDWLKDSDIVVAEVTTPSLGVGYELGKAEDWGKKVLCVYREVEGRRLSAMISGGGKFEIKKYENLNELDNVFTEFFKNF